MRQDVGMCKEQSATRTVNLLQMEGLRRSWTIEKIETCGFLSSEATPPKPMKGQWLLSEEKEFDKQTNGPINLLGSLTMAG